MSLKPLFLLVLLLSLSCSAIAQQFSTVTHEQMEGASLVSPQPPLQCGFTGLHKNLPFHQHRLQEKLDEQLRDLLLANPQHFRQRSATYRVPVVFHIVHDNGAENISNQRIYNAVEWLNESFQNTGYYDQNSGVNVDIEFCLAKRDPDGNLTNGITRTVSELTVLDKSTEDNDLKALIVWDPTCYINIWLVRDVIGSVAGYAYLPSAHGQPFDGIVSEAEYVGTDVINNNILTHEMGHYLGLFHTFRGGCNNDDCMMDGDRVCDTPPDNSTAGTSCNDSPNTCSTDTDSGFTTDQDDMIENYMDYGYWTCYNTFTQGQADRMIFFLTGIRSSLLDCPSCQDPCTVDISVVAEPDTIAVAVGTNAVVNLNTQFVDQYEWYINNTLVSTSATLDLPVDSLGNIVAIVKVGNADVNCEAFDTILIQPYCETIGEVIFASDTVQAVAGLSTTLSTTLNNASTAIWSFEGTEIGMGSQISYTFSEPGLHPVILEAVHNIELCNSFDTLLVRVECPAGQSVSLPDDFIILQEGASLSLPSNAQNVQGTLWQLDGVDISNDGEFNYTFDQAGIYGLLLTGISTVTSCDITDYTQIIVQCDPNLSIQSSTALITPGESISFSASSVEPILSYEWYVNGELASTSPTFDYTFNYGGEHHIYLIADFGGCLQRSENIEVIVYDICSFEDQNLMFTIDTLTTSWGIAKSYVDDGYLIGLSTRLIKLSNNFEVVWAKNYFGMQVMDVTPDYNGGYFITYFGIPGQDTKAFKIDEDGNTIWRRGIELNSPVGFPIFSDMITAVNGDPMMFERVNLNNRLYGYYDRFDQTTGEEIWTYEILDFHITDALAMADGGFVLSGHHNVQQDALCLVKVDYDGEIVWSTQFTPQDQEIQSAGQSYVAGYEDGSIFVAFDTKMDGEDYGHGNIAKVGADGNILWAKRIYDNTLPLASQHISGVTKSPNGDFIVSLTTNGFGTAQQESIIIRIDPLGNVEWAKSNSYAPNTMSHLQHPSLDKIICLGFGNGQPFLYQLDELGLMGGCEMTDRNISTAPRLLNQAFDIFIRTDLINYEEPPAPEGTDTQPNQVVLCSLEGTDGIDLQVNILEASLCRDSVSFITEICNGGTLTAPATLPVAFYDGSPLDPGSTLLPYSLPLNRMIESDSCYQFTFTLPNVFVNTPFIMPNDDGSATLPFNFIDDFPLTEEGECSYINNLDSISLEGLSNPIAPVLQLGNDTLICAGESILLSSSPGFDHYLWQDGSTDSSLLATAPGYYILEAAVECGFPLRDTIELIAPSLPTLDLGPDLSGCQNEIFPLKADEGFVSYLWQDGSTEALLTAWDPGIYWVEATDYCGNVWRDSVEITLEPGFTIELGEPLYICPGDSVEIDVQSSYTSFQWTPGNDASCADCPTTYLRPDTTTRFILTAEAGDCLSSDTLSVVILPTYATVDTFRLCAGDTININGEQIYEAGTYTNEWTTFQGCDSIITAIVEIVDAIETSESVSICAGDSAIIFGMPESTAGSYSQSFTAITGCDSMHTVNLTVLDTIQQITPVSICEGENIELFGQTVSASGTYAQTFNGFNGCDSTQIYELTVLSNASTNATATICSGEVLEQWGQLLSSPGIYDSTFMAVNGCDSTHALTLEVLDTVLTSEQLTICQGEEVDIFGSPISDEGQYIASYTGMNGCDSTHLVQLSVLDTSYTTQIFTICAGESIELFGETISQGGIYSQLYTNSLGCDSTHAITLNVLDTMFVSEIVSICSGDSINIFGSTVYEAGTYNASFTAVNGCDSTHQVILTVQDTIFSQSAQSICEGASIDIFGMSVEVAGDYSASFTATSGCDSIHTISLSVLDTVATFGSMMLCQGDSLLLNGDWISQAGIYPTLLSSTNGCDSTHYLEVSLIDTLLTEEALSICDGDSLLIFGSYETETGIYQGDFTAINGCDSIHVIELLVNPVHSNTLSMDHCLGDSSLIFGSYETEAGTYEQIYVNQLGCDSTVTIELSVLENPQTEVDLQPACDSQSNGSISVVPIAGTPPFTYQWAHTSENQSELLSIPGGTYNLTVSSSNGCTQPLIIELEEIFLPDYSFDFISTTCHDTEDGQLLISTDSEMLLFSLDGEEFSPETEYTGLSAGTYELLVQSPEGCMSEHTFSIEAPPVLLLQLDSMLSIEAGSSVQLSPQGSLDLFSVYSWTPADWLSCEDCPTTLATPPQSQLYTLTASTETGCSTSAGVFVQVTENPEDEIYFPNAFSPNGDGRNDRFLPQAGKNFEVLVFRIFDRWGGLLYESENQSIVNMSGWDGTSQGQTVMPGVYTYFITIRTDDGKEELRSGEVLLLR
jgi:gliding motility-associated-like protein